jgi:hypothetical protein
MENDILEHPVAAMDESNRQRTVVNKATHSETFESSILDMSLTHLYSLSEYVSDRNIRSHGLKKNSLDVVFVFVHASWLAGQLFPVCGTHSKCPPLDVGESLPTLLSNFRVESLYQLAMLIAWTNSQIGTTAQVVLRQIGE